MAHERCSFAELLPHRRASRLPTTEKRHGGVRCQSAGRAGVQGRLRPTFSGFLCTSSFAAVVETRNCSEGWQSLHTETGLATLKCQYHKRRMCRLALAALSWLTIPSHTRYGIRPQAPTDEPALDTPRHALKAGCPVENPGRRQFQDLGCGGNQGDPQKVSA